MINLVAMLNACMFSHSVVSDSILISWAVSLSAPLSLGFPRQEYWSELPFPPPGDLPDPGIKPLSPVSPALAGRLFTTEPPHLNQLHFNLKKNTP